MAPEDLVALAERQCVHALDEPEGQLCSGGASVGHARNFKAMHVQKAIRC